MKEIDCTGCKAGCCRFMSQMDSYTIPPQVFTSIKELDRGDGTCIHLADDYKCKVYDTRPDICRSSTYSEEGRQQMEEICKMLKEKIKEEGE